MKAPTHFTVIEGNSSGYLMLIGFLGVFLAMGLGSAYFMEHHGHVVTGMNNQIVWGMPHVFAVFLIVCASGALNVASISSVFSKASYKPLARLSGLLAIALLVGGLAILVLDLGRPDRLIIAMTHYNFKSIFAWNIYLYTGFLAIVAIYLWMMMERRYNKYTKHAGSVAFVWRLILTTGTGSIFGFLVAREAYDSAIMAPMFIVMSFSFGLAVFILVMLAIYNGTQRPIGMHIINRLKNLLGVFVAGALLLVVIFHLTKLYVTRLHGVEAFILSDGGIITTLFWLGQIVLGSIVPLCLLYLPVFKDNLKAVIASSVLVILGGLSAMYVIIIGGQAYPLDLFPGYEVKSSFYDGAINSYTPSTPEVLLGLGGIAIAGLIVTLGIKFLQFTPTSLADADVDPHHKAEN